MEIECRDDAVLFWFNHNGGPHFRARNGVLFLAAMVKESPVQEIDAGAPQKQCVSSKSDWRH